MRLFDIRFNTRPVDILRGPCEYETVPCVVEDGYPVFFEYDVELEAGDTIEIPAEHGDDVFLVEVVDRHHGHTKIEARFLCTTP